MTSVTINPEIIFQETRNKLVVALFDLAEIAEDRGTEVIIRQNKTEVHEKLDKLLRERADNVQKKEAFKLAVVGEFNAGKSTFINALLERQIVSISWKPTTAAKTILRYGEPERFKVTYLPELNQPPVIRESNNLFEDLANFTSDPSMGDDEARLRGTKKSLAELVKEVEVWCYSKFLKDREIEVIDTPGLGSVFEAHKEVTYGLIPEVDATMFLFPMDPGVGEEDILFLQFVRQYVNRMFFVMTKADTAGSEEEKQERADFNRTTIEIKTGIEIENKKIYPVSAKLQLERPDSKDSGFPDVVEELISFLVSSSGVARLEVPFEFARENWAVLKDEVDRDVRSVDQSLQSLKDELAQLNSEKVAIEHTKNELLSDISARVQDMILSATEGIDDLPLRLQMKVENAVQSYGIKELRHLDKNLQIVMQDVINDWVKGKEERFESSVTLLQRHVEKELQRIASRIDAIESGNRSAVTFAGNYTQNMFQQAALKMGVGVMQRAGVGGAVGAGVILGLLVAGFVLPMLLIIGVPIAGAAAMFGKDLFNLSGKFKQEVIRKLREPLPPPNKRNLYETLVHGGFVNGRPQSGLKESMTAAFNSWGSTLKEQTELVVVNLVDSRVRQLEKHIREKETGQWDRQRILDNAQQQLDALQQIERRLIEIEAIMNQMGQGVFGPAGDEGDTEMIE